ncbi:DeoR/GlpR family DNA-binding transcription regulator [Silvimonas sp. JCM 19000]
MLPNRNTPLRRRLQIADLVRKHGEITVEDLSRLLGVSSVTIRSDLNYLEEQGYLMRSAGKARHIPSLQQKNALSNAPLETMQKRDELAALRSAAEWVADGQTISLLSGALVARLVPVLAGKSNLSLVLQDVALIAPAQLYLDCEIHVCAGRLTETDAGLTGAAAEQSITARPIDLCVLEPALITPDGKMYGPSVATGRVFRTALRHAGQTLVLASLIGSDAPGEFEIGDLTMVDGVIVDVSTFHTLSAVLDRHPFTVKRVSEHHVLLTNPHPTLK